MATRDSWPTDNSEDMVQLQAQIRDNERIWLGFRHVEVDIIGAHSLRELIKLLIGGIRDTFPNVSCASIACLDPDYALARLLAQETEPRLDDGEFVTISRDSLESLFSDLRRPKLGPCNANLQSVLFPSYKDQLGSMALMPLVLRGKLIGSLNQASRHATHYQQNAATDFLEHLAAVSAMCIDNVVNRERLKADGLTDPLTGVANRRFFERRLHEELTRWSRRGGSLICMLVDIDHFKQVNDTFGHQAGDRVLRQVADLLGKDLRASDVLARYGGEEFVLLLPETSEKQGSAIAERLRHVVECAPFNTGTKDRLTVTLSAGLTVLDRRSGEVGNDPASTLLEQADAALYRAKQTGRNKVVIAR
ncbi:MAG: DUF484 family protein [Acidiferrobacterales bacterium]